MDEKDYIISSLETTDGYYAIIKKSSGEVVFKQKCEKDQGFYIAQRKLSQIINENK